MLGSALSAAEPASDWPKVLLPPARELELSGAIGAALQRGVERLAQEPYTVEWLLADISFKTNRIFTNYSGDVSGRFLELAALTSPPGRRQPPTLDAVLKAAPGYQNPDGHFGLAVDLSKPLQRNATPIPMLWGNARLLVGLVTAARECHNPELLATARRLGDFYVMAAEQLCSPAREAELRATGSGGDGYACCYFPAIESLAMLYRATKDNRYLATAQRMAECFRKFDALPVDHSHGNLCAWRGILELYDITRERAWLDRAQAKWEAAVQGGYVWPIGGVGEHWQVNFHGDEGCSESDWLRFNLELWRCTGETRYLDMAERLLHNQYAANQCANGGYGWCPLDGDAAGPIAKKGTVQEWNFCCSFHGPLGLHFLKSYLAAGSERGLFVNFPLDFTARLKAAQREWKVVAKTKPSLLPNERLVELEIIPDTVGAAVSTTLWLRWPAWATEMFVADGTGQPMAAGKERGYLRLEHQFKAGETLVVTYRSQIALEARRFKPVKLSSGPKAQLNDVSLLDGPNVLFATPARGNGRTTLLATLDETGRLGFPNTAGSGYFTVALPGTNATAQQIAAALESARPIVLRPWSALATKGRAAFACNLVAVPTPSLPASSLTRFTERTRDFEKLAAGQFFGENLEAKPDCWLAGDGWKFAPTGLLVEGGDIGLLDGEGYGDYRFDFDLTLPKEGQGLAGWVVRAQSPEDCLMFQLQSADSPYHAPEYKTKPNTLRPHLRRQGRWTVAEPVPLPKEIRRGETHHLTANCRGSQVEILLDGEKILAQSDQGLHSGTVGFRATSATEQGLFQKVSLNRLDEKSTRSAR
ncbi:MAG: glycoside hydrolase family 127 protein [Verrucomicrobia bacterium]|nr:glycoside hydrolase family 127 protein [Verrucomicrobiota bacterium]